MIDQLDITIPVQHDPFGEERIKFSKRSLRPTHQPLSMEIQLYPDGERIDVTSLNDGASIRIRGCPLKALQGHNVFGSDDVRLLASSLICKVLDRLGITYTDEQRAAWMAGEFAIEAIAITHRFQLPHGVTVKQLCQHMLRHARAMFDCTWRCCAAGMAVDLSNSGTAWLFGDKFHELKDAENAKLQPPAIIANDGDNLLQRLRDEAEGKVYAQLQFTKKYLAKCGLDRGSAWTLESAREGFLHALWSFWVEDSESVERPVVSADDIAGLHLRRTLVLWAHGEQLEKLLLPSMLANHRSKIRDAIGVDIMRDVPTFETVSLEKIFSPRNMAQEFPGWATRYEPVAFGIRPTQQQSSSTNLKAS